MVVKNGKLSSRFKKSDEKYSLKKSIKKLTFAKNTHDKKDVPAEITNVADEHEIEPENGNFLSFEADLKQALMDKIETVPVWFDYTADKQKELIKSFVESKIAADKVFISDNEQETLTENLFASVRGFGPLDYLIARENVSAVFVNGTNSVYIEIGGKILNTEMKLSEKQVDIILNNILIMAKQDKSKNILNVKLNDLFVTIIGADISLSGTNISIRKNLKCDVDFIIKSGMMTKEIFDFLVSSVDCRKNIVISGDINSGKTFLLNALINSSLTGKRAVLLEEFQQVDVQSDNLMKFVADKNSSDYSSLVSNILKMSPEYIFADFNTPVPEMSEVSGSIITLRASNENAAISKLVTGFITKENLPEKYARTRVFTDYDYLVQISKMKDGSRKLASILELKPAKTAALSVKSIAKFVDGQYVTEIPQTSVPVSAEPLISQSGSMSSRFYSRK